MAVERRAQQYIYIYCCARLSTAIQADLKMVRHWGEANRVLFNADKTQLLPISLSDGPDFEVMFVDVHLLPSPSINLLGVRVSSYLSWRQHILSLVASASRKL